MECHAMQPPAICLYDGPEAPKNFVGVGHHTPDHIDQLVGRVSVCMQKT